MNRRFHDFLNILYTKNLTFCVQIDKFVNKFSERNYKTTQNITLQVILDSLL